VIPQNIKDMCIDECKSYKLTKSDERVKELGEVFTPTELILEIFDQFDGSVWEDGKTFLDPTCGNGQFLAAALIVKIALGHTNTISTIYGVDIMQDNIDECKQRLLSIVGDTVDNRRIIGAHILCKDGLTYDYSFEDAPTETLFAW